MAYAEKRKDGYRLRASCGYDASGKQITRSKSWRPEPGWSVKRTEKELQTALVRFQEECDSCSISGNIKFSVFAAQWLKEYAEKTMKKSSIERMRKYAPRADAALGHLSMDKITTRHMQRFVNNLGEDGVNKTTGGGLKLKTIKNYLSYVSSVFQYAARMGMLKQNPCRNVVLPKPDAAEREVMTLEQAQVFVDSLDAAPLQWKAFCVLAIYSGLRRGELLGLEWPDIDFDNPLILITVLSQFAGNRSIAPQMGSIRTRRRLPAAAERSSCRRWCLMSCGRTELTRTRHGFLWAINGTTSGGSLRAKTENPCTRTRRIHGLSGSASAPISRSTGCITSDT